MWLAHLSKSEEDRVGKELVTLVSGGPVRPINDTAKTLASVFDQTLGHLVTRR